MSLSLDEVKRHVIKTIPASQLALGNVPETLWIVVVKRLMKCKPRPANQGEARRLAEQAAAELGVEYGQQYQAVP